MPEERLQKLLANAGVASRRKAEELITAGQVSVNGKTVTELGSKADLAVDQVKVNGQLISKPKHFVYFAFNKPKDVISTVRDPEGRTTVMSFFRGLQERIYPVGRLDYASEGLMLLTNDGEFANRLMNPASQITKTYLVKANGPLSSEQEVTFRRGIPMHGRKTAPAGLQLIREGDNPWYEVRLVEGRQNQIRIMFKHFGRLVEKLKRIRIAFLEVGDLKPGAYRTLTRPEMDHFRRILALDGDESAPRPHVDLTRELHSPSPRAIKRRRAPKPSFTRDERPVARPAKTRLSEGPVRKSDPERLSSRPTRQTDESGNRRRSRPAGTIETGPATQKPAFDRAERAERRPSKNAYSKAPARKFASGKKFASSKKFASEKEFGSGQKFGSEKASFRPSRPVGESGPRNAKPARAGTPKAGAPKPSFRPKKATGGPSSRNSKMNRGGRKPR